VDLRLYTFYVEAGMTDLTTRIERALSITRAATPHMKMSPEIFWTRVNKTDDCWLWRGALNSSGYANVFWNGRQANAHRVSYELSVGPIPEGLQIDHLCRVRHCVNPAHLEPVTSKINTLRGVSPLAINSRKTHCQLGHELSGDNLRLEKSGSRVCRECKRIKGRADWPERKKKRNAKKALAALDKALEGALP
jgi:hypothetical protein